MNQLITLTALCFGCALAALLDGAIDLAKSLGLIAGFLLCVLAFVAMLHGPSGETDPRPLRTSRDDGEGGGEYYPEPEPPKETHGLVEHHYAERGGMLETGHPSLPPMTREQDPIAVEPDTIFAPRSKTNG